ncbi:MAG: alpha/beta fold hydrolase [Elusimicrobiota bacterium]
MRLLLLACALLIPSVAAAQAPAGAGEKPLAPAVKKKPVRKQRELPGDVVEIKTKDGWTLAGSYQPAREDQLTFILLHDAHGRRQNWYWLTRRMERKGLGFLAIDMRGHGQSQNPPEGKEASWRKFKRAKRDNDWENIREDVEAAVAFLEEHGVPSETIALGGADVGGSIALKYAALHEEIEMVFLLSPGFSYQEVLTVNAMRAYRRRPILLVVADDDRRSSTETPILFQFARNAAGPENATLLRTEKGHGTRMLYYNKGVTDKIVGWIEDPVVPPEIDISSGTTMSPYGESGADDGSLPTDGELERLDEQVPPADD